MIKNIKQENIHLFWEKVKKTDTCWEWTAAKNEKGYGVFGIGKETDKAHRISYRLLVSEIPQGLFVCHKCDNPKCVNPDHLFLGTAQDNVKDMILKKRNKKPPMMAGWNKKQLPDEIYKELGTQNDTVIGKKYGFSKYVIARARKKLGIPALQSQTRFKRKEVT